MQVVDLIAREGATIGLLFVLVKEIDRARFCLDTVKRDTKRRRDLPRILYARYNRWRTMQISKTFRRTYDF